ncbi:glycerophosphoryl diester phosphodiesterase [Rhizobium sp. NBRC 114257]|nr:MULTISPECIES: glycerophosphodiester phosphodiesterase family protein [Rhizobium]GES48918.1 glycerophosphoryl diester phosphodiesterase [Rhizobium dioscoreae]GLU80361.1 glycerophosphoryl diester phosphodiesterase [Rhizobium sp. NBRC 114257]
MDYADYIADPSRDCAIVVHRGIWRAAPENSLLAIEQAISAGYDVVEIDVRCSSDGEFFLLHDDTLERTAGLARKAEGLTLQQLSNLNLRDRDGGETNRMTDEKLPSLKDVFDLTRGRIFLHLDVKRRDMIPGVIACARAMGVDRQVDFWSDLKTSDDLAWIQSNVSPEMVLLMAKTRLGSVHAESQLDLLRQLKPLLCEIYFDSLDQLAARKALFVDAGMRLWVNTLDSVSCAGFTDTAALQDPAAIWGRLVDAGVSAIQTDEAEALRIYLDSR